MDCNWITNRLLVGAIIESEADAKFLRDGGVTHVINGMQDGKEEKWVRACGMSYLHLGLPDDGVQKPLWWFKQAIEWAMPALAYPKNKLYVHCRGGVNRGPSLAYAVLRATGLSAKDAKSIMKRERPQVGIAYRADADKAITELGYD